jgi:hypothetical protein
MPATLRVGIHRTAAVAVAQLLSEGGRQMRRLHGAGLGIATLFLLMWVNQAGAMPVVVPSADTNTEGNPNNGFPFNIGAFGLSSQRYQQVYLGSDFGLATPQSITQLLFRPDAGFGAPFSTTLSNVQINLSTTSKAPDALSSTFANNVGPDDKVVYSGPLPLSSSFTGPGGGPKAFDISVNLQNPFLYSPAAGNLLLDVRNFGGGTTTQFDAAFTQGDPVSRLFTLSSNGVNDLNGDVDTLGLVTEFNFGTPSVVPEPSTWSLLALGLAVALSVHYFNSRRLRTKWTFSMSNQLRAG